MFSKCLIDQVLCNSLSDSSLSMLKKSSDLVSILVHVNDLPVTGSNSNLIDSIVTSLSSAFAPKD